MGKFRDLVEQQVKEIEDEYTRKQELEDYIYDLPVEDLIFEYGNYNHHGVITVGGDLEDYFGKPVRLPSYEEVQDLTIDEAKVPELIEKELADNFTELTEEDKQYIKEICASDRFSKFMDKVYERLEDLIIADHDNGGDAPEYEPPEDY